MGLLHGAHFSTVPSNEKNYWHYWWKKESWELTFCLCLFGGDGKLTAISVHRLSPFSASSSSLVNQVELRSTHFWAGGGQSICTLITSCVPPLAVPIPRKPNSSLCLRNASEKDLWVFHYIDTNDQSGSH